MTWTLTSEALAELVEVPTSTLCSWANRWAGPSGHGHPRALGPVDAMVARAWKAIAIGADPCRSSAARQDMAEAAIRARPRRWLLLTASGATTHDTAGDAAVALKISGAIFGRIIDLEPA